EVAIAERADVLRERLLRGAPGGLLDRLHLAPQRQPPGEPGGVREYMSQRDVVLATTAEVRDELAQRHREVEGRLAHEREHERRRRELGERCEIEDRVDGARRVRTGVRIGAQRSDGERVGLTLALDADDTRGAERSDRSLRDGTRR